MCGICGCDHNQPTTITSLANEAHHHHLHEQGIAHHHHERVLTIKENVTHHNDTLAEQNRNYLNSQHILTLNFVSSPGSGKTTILEKTIEQLKDHLSFYVIEGDQQTLNDAKRIEKTGVPVVQINTGKGCHLDAHMIKEAIDSLHVKENSILIIENVGNLVCPAMFDLGETKRVVIVSVTEGEDKPLKYPDMFASSDICIISKVDLLPHLVFNLETLKQSALSVNPDLEIIEYSAFDSNLHWETWLKNAFSNHLKHKLKEKNDTF